jgi:anti-sigma factor RsiW
VRCASCKVLLDDYVDGTLPAHRAKHVRRHLDECSSCAPLLEELRVVDALLLAACIPKPPADLTFRVMAEVRGLPAHRVRHAAFLSIGATYLAFAWALFFAWFWFGGAVSHASLGLLREMATQYVSAGGALVNAAAHLFGHETVGVTAAMLGLLAVDSVFAGTVVAAYFIVLPRLAAHVATVPEVYS